MHMAVMFGAIGYAKENGNSEVSVGFLLTAHHDARVRTE